METSFTYSKLFLIKARLESFPDIDLDTNKIEDLTV